MSIRPRAGIRPGSKARRKSLWTRPNTRNCALPTKRRLHRLRCSGDIGADQIQFHYSSDLEKLACGGTTQMQDIDQRDRELLGALQGEIPLVSTPFAVVGQLIDMSEKEVIKRTERLKREGLVRQLSAQFDARSLGYRSCLVAAKVDEERIDQAAAIINAHPGVTQNYRRNNDFNLWFTIAVSPNSQLGLDKTIQILGELAECETVRPLPTLKLFKSSASEEHHAEEGGS